MGGTTTPGPSAEVAMRVVKAQTELIKTLPNVRHTVIFETMRMDKVNSIPNHAMAFNSRSNYINALINLSWDNETVDIEGVRAGIKGLIKAVQGDDVGPSPSYGNYGESINIHCQLVWETLEAVLDLFARGFADFISEGDNVLATDKVEKLFGANYLKLQTIKAKYE